jgi:dephospho-CoA kinase
MKTIGLTGGIATGKSTVASLLRDHHDLPVIDADQIARDVVAPGTPALAEIQQFFGEGVLLASGALNRKALGAIVMADADKRQRLEAITHPRIGEAIGEWLARQVQQGQRWAVVEAALMIETGSAQLYDLLLVISCSAQVQLSRLTAREGYDTATATRWIKAQLPLAQKEAVAHHVIVNDSDQAALAEKVQAFIDWLAKDGA